MYIFLTIRKGKKEYYATVSSFTYSGRDLWLCVWGDESKSIVGNCGYIPNGKVTNACYSDASHPRISDETLKILKAW